MLSDTFLFSQQSCCFILKFDSIYVEGETAAVEMTKRQTERTVGGHERRGVHRDLRRRGGGASAAVAGPEVVWVFALLYFHAPGPDSGTECVSEVF